jgi:hypothetical protein
MTKRSTELPGITVITSRNGCAERVKYGLLLAELRPADREALGLVQDINSRAGDRSA